MDQKNEALFILDPIEHPVLSKDDIAKNLPIHRPTIFEEYIELKDENDKAVGFLIKQYKEKENDEQIIEEKFFFDPEGGWRERNGCYYDKDGQPAGWFVRHPGEEYHEHFYDIDGMYVHTDVEDSNDEDDEGDEQQVQEDLQQEKQIDKDIKEYEK